MRAARAARAGAAGRQTAAAKTPVAFSQALAMVGNGSPNATLTTPAAAITPGPLVNPCLVCVVVTSHANTRTCQNYSAWSCSSSVDGALTELVRRDIRDSNQGGAAIFYKTGVSPDAANITSTYTFGGGQYGDRIRMIVGLYYNVNQAQPFRQYATGAPDNLALAAALSGMEPSSLGVFGEGSASSVAGFSGNQRQLGGSSVNGLGDYVLLGDAAPVDGAVALTSTSANSAAWILGELQAA